MYHLMEQCVDDDRLLHIVSDADANEEIRQSHLASHSFSYETESSEKGTGIAQHYIDRLQLAFKALIIEECELLLQIFYCWAHCESRFIVFFIECKVTAIIPYLQALLSARYKKTFRKTMIIGLLSVPLSLKKKRFLHS